MRLIKIKKIIYNMNRSNFYIAFIGIVIFFLPELTFAATQDGVMDFNIIIKVASWILWLLTQLVGLFLNPEWQNGSAIWIDSKLKELWILVSNIVYFIFAFLLIWIAFMNIIWKEWENYQLKQALPRFAVGILIVPFSWFVVQFVTSVAWVLTVSVLSLPFDTFKNDDAVLKVMEEGVALNCVMNLSVQKDIDNLKDGKWDLKKGVDKTTYKGQLDKLFHCGKKDETGKIIDGEKTPFKTIIQTNPYGILSLYIYWVLKVDKLLTMEAETLDIVKTIPDLLTKWLFDIIFLIAYLIIALALAFALFIRWVWLWIYMIFSPAFWLLYFFNKWEWWEWAFQKFNFKEFIWLAMVPVYVSAALSFWLLFLFVIWSNFHKEANGKPIDMSAKIGTKKIFESSDSESKICAWELMCFTIKWKWLLWSSSSKAWEVFWAVQSSLWRLMLNLFALALLWIWVFTALKQSKITEEITNPISEFWKSMWSLVAKAPQFMPIIPTGKWWLSMSWLQNAWWTFSRQVESSFSTKWQQVWQDFADASGFWANDMVKSIQQVKAGFPNIKTRSREEKWTFLKRLTWKIQWENLNKFLRDDVAKREYIESLEDSLWEIDQTIKTNLLTKRDPADWAKSMNDLYKNLKPDEKRIFEKTFGTSVSQFSISRYLKSGWEWKSVQDWQEVTINEEEVKNKLDPNNTSTIRFYKNSNEITDADKDKWDQLMFDTNNEGDDMRVSAIDRTSAWEWKQKSYLIDEDTLTILKQSSLSSADLAPLKSSWDKKKLKDVVNFTPNPDWKKRILRDVFWVPAWNEQTIIDYLNS